MNVCFVPKADVQAYELELYSVTRISVFLFCSYLNLASHSFEVTMSRAGKIYYDDLSKLPYQLFSLSEINGYLVGLPLNQGFPLAA